MFPLSDTQQRKGFPFITIALIAFTSYVFFLQLTRPDAFTFVYALIPSRINFTAVYSLYPFITSIFLHGGWLHILSNMWFLWIFGDNVELEIGHFRYLFLYLISGITGALAQYLITPHSAVPMLGASGAIAGVLGTYYILFPHNKIRTFIPVFGFFTLVNISASMMLGYWFLLQILSGAISLPGASLDQGGVAFWAHIAGFVTGLFIGKVIPHTQKSVLEGEVVS